MPPTFQALLAARLDQLERPSGACSSAAPSRARSSTAAPCRRSRATSRRLTPRLTALVRKELSAATAQFAGEDAFRFRHLLSATRPTRRSRKRRARSSTSGSPSGSTARADARRARRVLGYHLEQAERYRNELGMPVARAVSGGRRERPLAAAGRQAFGRQTFAAAATLLGRAAAP